MGPLLYWLRVRLRAQGSRNDIIDKDRGFGAWVDENLDISQSTADRWADKYAVENGLKETTSSHVTKSEDDPFYREIIDEHKGEQQIAFNYWVKTAVHAQFEKALITIQKQLGLKNKNDALVQGVLYAAEAIDGAAKSGRLSRVVGQLSYGSIGQRMEAEYEEQVGPLTEEERRAALFRGRPNKRKESVAPNAFALPRTSVKRKRYPCSSRC